MPDPKDTAKPKEAGPRGNMERREEEAPAAPARAPLFTMRQLVIVIVMMVVWGGILLIVVKYMGSSAKDTGDVPTEYFVPLPDVAKRFKSANPETESDRTIRIQSSAQLAGDLDEDARKTITDSIKSKEPRILESFQDAMGQFKPEDFQNSETKPKLKARFKDILDEMLGGPGKIKDVPIYLKD